MSKKAGLASAVESDSTKGVTTLASRFEASEPTSSNPSTRVSDLATRFSNTSTPASIPIPTPSSTTKSPSKTISTPQTPGSPRLSKKVSDLQRAFSSSPSGTSDFSARQSAFAKAGSESKVSAFARKLDTSEGPTERVAGVARAFESRDTGIGKAGFVPRLEKVVEKGGKEDVNDKVDRFDVVASRFEKGTAGEKSAEKGEEQEGKARERFLDAAKRFGG